MIEFRIRATSKKSFARLGVISTPHGEVETPAFVPVATNAAVKALTSEEALAAKSQILIANTFHLHLKPGERIVSKGGGLHTFMNWPRPLMTDSGGFQVFSLGFGSDLAVGKVLKFFPGRREEMIHVGSQPKFLKITEEGVFFRSLHDGKKLFLGPRESIKIQEALGADIIFAFDECTPPLASRKYVESALRRTHRWARECLEIKKTEQAIFGIVQGSRFRELREKSARFIDSLDFQGFGIGGDLGSTKKDLIKILRWTLSHLDRAKPRHLLGIGHIGDMEEVVKTGIDLFDCTVPTHYARHGTAFTNSGKLNLSKTVFLKDKKPLDRSCVCFVCQNYRRNYIAHLLRAKEITALKLLTFHNLYFFNTAVEKVREKIRRGVI